MNKDVEIIIDNRKMLYKIYKELYRHNFHPITVYNAVDIRELLWIKYIF